MNRTINKTAGVFIALAGTLFFCALYLCSQHPSHISTKPIERYCLLDSTIIYYDPGLGDCRFMAYPPARFLEGKDGLLHFVITERDALDSLTRLIAHKRRIVSMPDFEVDTFFSMLLFSSSQIDTISFSDFPLVVQINRVVYEDHSGEMFLWCFDKCWEQDKNESWGIYSFGGASPRDFLLSYIQTDAMNELLPDVISVE